LFCVSLACCAGFSAVVQEAAPRPTALRWPRPTALRCARPALCDDEQARRLNSLIAKVATSTEEILQVCEHYEDQLSAANYATALTWLAKRKGPASKMNLSSKRPTLCC